MKKLISVPYIDQSVHYPTGCESVSTVMLLQYLGYDLSVDTFIENYLECKNFEDRDGEWYGPDPRKYFCGSPYDEESYGCYSPVIVKALNHVFSDSSYYAVDETGTSVDDLIHTYIDQDMPVIFWACINMREPIIGPSWKLLDDSTVFTWISNEHCMLLVGYDEDSYYFNDPYDNNGIIRYEKETVKNRHDAQHQMAVGICKKS